MILFSFLIKSLFFICCKNVCKYFMLIMITSILLSRFCVVGGLLGIGAIFRALSPMDCNLIFAFSICPTIMQPTTLYIQLDRESIFILTIILQILACMFCAIKVYR